MNKSKTDEPNKFSFLNIDDGSIVFKSMDGNLEYQLRCQLYQIPSPMDQLATIRYCEKRAFNSSLYEKLLGIRSNGLKSFFYSGKLSIELLKKSFQYFHSMSSITNMTINAKIQGFGKLNRVDIVLAPHNCSINFNKIPSCLSIVESSTLALLYLSCIIDRFDFLNLTGYRLQGNLLHQDKVS